MRAVPLLWIPLTLFKVPWSLVDPACLWSQYQIHLTLTVTVAAPPSAWVDQTLKKRKKKDKIPLFPHCSDCCCC